MRLLPIVLEQIKQCKRDVLGILGQCFRRYTAGSPGRFCVISAIRYFTQCAQATLAQDMRRRFRNGCKDATDAARFIADRAIRESEIAFFSVAIALEKQELIL